MAPRDGFEGKKDGSSSRDNTNRRQGAGSMGRRWDARRGQFVDVARTDGKGRPQHNRNRSSDEEGGQYQERSKRGEGNRRGKGTRTFNRKHNQQRGGDRGGHRNSQGQRPGFRDERLAIHANEPDLPEDINVRDLDSSVRQDLRSLSKDNADAVAKHMIMAATWMADDPQLALRHARAAKNRAGRVSVVRETNGIAAYHAGEWKEALSELRAARRMSGGPGLIAVMADSERGLGRPEKALEMAREEDLSGLNRADSIELAIVLAGIVLQIGGVTYPWSTPALWFALAGVPLAAVLSALIGVGIGMMTRSTLGATLVTLALFYVAPIAAAVLVLAGDWLTWFSSLHPFATLSVVASRPSAVDPSAPYSLPSWWANLLVAAAWTVASLVGGFVTFLKKPLGSGGK